MRSTGRQTGSPRKEESDVVAQKGKRDKGSKKDKESRKKKKDKKEKKQGTGT